MITSKQIHNARAYMRVHLSQNDYYSENETVIGQWHGKAAQMLGLEGQEVNARAFEALRSNRHPQTGERLTPRSPKVAYHDFVVSAPKSVSVVAMVGGDERVIEAFDRCVQNAHERLESMAAVRLRKGEHVNSERMTRTGNAIAAVFRHDTSRLLDPQLHTHLVYANASWDEQSGRWLALQPREMNEQSKEWIRDKFYRELEQECRKLGYAIERDSEAFRLTGIDRSIDYAFSQRAIQRDRFIERYKELFGQEPSKKRIEHFIKEHKSAATKRFATEYRERFGAAPSKEAVDNFVQDWRSSKMAHSTREKVHAVQLGRITSEQAEEIKSTVSIARSERETNSQAAEPIKQEELQAQSHSPAHLQSVKVAERREIRDQIARQKKGKRTKHNQKTDFERMIKAKKGLEIAAALRGHPTKLMARRVHQLARRKSHGTQRRAY